MANHLRMAMIHAILTLHQRGWSKRRIARELGVDRGAVTRHLASLMNAVSDSATRPPAIRRRHRRRIPKQPLRQ